MIITWWILSQLHVIFTCTGPDDFLVWGNTFYLGFTTHEFQCYVGRFE